MTSKVQYETGDKDLRPWGEWEVLATGQAFVVKRIAVNPGQTLSLQSHDHRNEHWTILSGRARVTLEDESFLLTQHETVFIPCGSKHRVGNPGPGVLTMIEIQTGDILDETDIIRYADEYGRVTPIVTAPDVIHTNS